MYNDLVMSIFKNPQHVGEIKGADGMGKVGNVSCGDIMQIFLKIEDNIVKDAKFKTFGCAAAIVSSSVACDKIIGLTLEELEKFDNKEILDYLGEMPTNKIHCSILAKEAIEEALKDYHKKQAKLKK